MKSDDALLADMLRAAFWIRRFLSGFDRAAFEADERTREAVVRKLEIIGEAANRVSPDTQAAIPRLPWREIIGMRHRLIHGYDFVDWNTVWETAQGGVPALLSVLEERLGLHESDLLK